MELTDNILKAAFTTLSKATRAMVLTSIGPALERYDISTPRRLAAFLGQCHHESAGFTRFKENLKYSRAGLLKTWPTRFNPANVDYYARNPVRIANRVYGGRMGNGSEASGEAALYIGRGPIQLTGKDNYSAFAGAMGMTLPDVVKYLETPEGGFMAAAWFWSRNNLNRLADGWEITNISTRINGKHPAHGLTERIKLSNAAFKALS